MTPPRAAETRSDRADGVALFFGTSMLVPLGRRALLFVTILAAQFVLFEAGLRVAGGSEAAPEFQALFMRDPRVGHRLQPGATAHFRTREFATDIAINSAGVRDVEFGPKAPGERRVVVLGDSLVMAVQVPLERTFVKRLEARLNAADPAHRWRVINAGVQGYGPVEAWLFYDHVVAAFDPDIVLVAVFVGNDAIEAFDSAARVERAGVVADLFDNTERMARRVVRRSMVLQTVRLRVRMMLDRVRVSQAVPERPLATYLADPPPDVAEGLEAAARYLAKIATRAEAHGARTGLVLVPARFQLDDDDYGRLRDIVAATGASLVRDAATERFAATLAPLGLPLFDLLPALRADEDRASLFFKENVHFTERGHEVAAAALETFVRGDELRPADAPSERVADAAPDRRPGSRP